MSFTVFIGDQDNSVAEETLHVALNYIRRNPRVGLMIDGLYSVKIHGDDAQAILETRMSSFIEFGLGSILIVS